MHETITFSKKIKNNTFSWFSINKTSAAYYMFNREEVFEIKTTKICKRRHLNFDFLGKLDKHNLEFSKTFFSCTAAKLAKRWKILYNNKPLKKYL